LTRADTHPELPREPAVLGGVVQVQVVVEVSLQGLVLLLVTHPPEEDGPPARTHRQREARPRRGLVPRGVHSGPGPLLWVMEGGEGLENTPYTYTFIDFLNIDRQH